MAGKCKHCGSPANQETQVCIYCAEKLELWGIIIGMVKQAKEERDRGKAGKRH